VLFALLGFGSTTVDNAPSGADTATTPTTWIGPVVTPGQYGAACNGSTDDTTAMQNAINAATAAGEPLQLPANSMCVISSMLKMPSGTRIEGAGFGSILKFTWFDASGSASGGAHYLTNADGSGDSNYTLTNFTVAGGGTGLPSGLNAEHPNRLASAVQLHNVTGFTINGIQVRDAPGVSISYLASQHGLIESNHVNHSGRDGITGFATSGLNLAHVTVTNNTISDVGDDAIAVDLPQSGTPPRVLPTDITISDNTITGWPNNPNGKQLGRGIALNGVNGASVTGNTIKNSYSAGLEVSGCTAKWCGGTFAKWPATNITATGNTITNAGQNYAGSTEGQNSQPTYGVYVYNSAAPVTINGNTITNSLSGPVLNAGCTGGCTIQVSGSSAA
jgi:hypothetical protein